MAGYIGSYFCLRIAEFCSRKWRNIRDAFFRSRRNNKIKSGQGVTKTKQYKFSKILNFLGDEDNEVSSSETNMPSVQVFISQEGDSSSVSELFPPLDVSQSLSVLQASPCTTGEILPRITSCYNSHHEEPQTSPPHTSMLVPRRKRKGRGEEISLVDRAILNALNKEDDSDLRFLKSLAPALRRLPSMKNMKVKIDILKLMYAAEFGDL